MEKSIIHKKLHGRVIHYNDLSKTLPSRNRFLNKELHQSVSNKLSNLKPLLFMPNGLWDEKPMQDAEYQKSKYKVVLFGILEDGQRINVILGNIEPYFEVKIPDKDHKGNKIENKTLFGNQLFEIIEGLKVNEKYDGKCQPTHFEVVSGKPFKYYQEDLCYYIRIYFDKTAHRKAAINHIRELKYETVHDDLNCYYRVVCRDYLISYGSWILLDNYNIQDAGTNKYFKDGCINIDVKCLKCMQLSDLKVLYSNEIPEWIPKDYTMTMCWDIETYNADEDGKIPQPEFPNHRMFMIGMTFQWHNSSDQLVRICLVDHPSAPHPDFLTVVCDNEQNLIKAFARCYNKMRADIVMGFNDSGYDWPWIIKRAQKYPGALKYISKMFDACIDKKDLTDKDVLWNYKSLQVKIEATLDVKGNNLQVPGYIPVDVMIIFRQLYPTSEKWGLNYFLEKNKLGGKADMPYQEMFDIYKRLDELVIAGETNGQEFIKLKDKMKLVAEYCVIDSQRCHELMKIRSVVQDRREVAVLSYTSMFDTFYRANGMKVRNLVIGLGQPFGLKFSNIHNQIVESGKYPGAYVFPPIKGLLTSKLSISERIEKGNRGYAEYSAWTELSENEIQICFDYIANNGISNIDNDGIVPNSTLPECMNTMLQESTGRPITGLDFSSLYPSLIMTYNLSPEYIIIDKAYARKIDKMLNIDGSKKHILHKIKFEYNGRTIRGWSVRHDNKLNPNSSDYKFGLFGKILKDLFDTRKVLKKGNTDFKGLEYWEHRKEQLKLLSADEFSTEAVQAEFEEVCFQFNALDSKQKALKVFMNTFYGEVGNKSSPLFLLQVAGGITSAGQHNIKSAQKYVENHGCKVYYGDSVLEDEPIMIRYTEGPLAGNIDIVTIDNVPQLNDWFDYPQFKPDETEPLRIMKQQHLPVAGLETWTSRGWKPIRRVIRHKTNKRIFRINTHTGCVDVTEDHSLLSSERIALKSCEVKVDDELFHSFPDEFPSEAKFHDDEKVVMSHCSRCNTDKPSYEFYKKANGNLFKPCRKCVWIANGLKRLTQHMKVYFSEEEYYRNAGKNLTEEEAYIFGLFHGDGSCGEYTCSSGKKCSWAINNQNMNYLNQLLEYLAIVEPHFKFKLLDTLDSSGVYKLVATGKVALLVRKYRKLFYDKRKYKIVPMCILNSPVNIKRAYINGMFAADGYKNGEINNNIIEIGQKGKINIQSIYYLLKSIGYDNIIIRIRNDKPDIYTLRHHGSGNHRKSLTAIKKILELHPITTDQWVYDLETEDGTFLVGVGCINVKNTDSLYETIPETNFKQLDIDYYTEKISKLNYWKEMVRITFVEIKKIQAGVNEWFLRDNGTEFLKMSYEEVLFPVLFLAKKKYAGVPHISEPNFSRDVDLFIRGLELKKRGVSDLLKNVCNDILRKCVDSENILTVIEIVQNSIIDFYTREWNMDSDFDVFIMTGVYRPDKKNVKMHTFRDRMIRERNINIKPGERIKYVVVKKYPYIYDDRGRKTALSIGDKMELAEVAKAEGIPIDKDYYMSKSINGQLARLITYHPDFHAKPVENNIANDDQDPDQDQFIDTEYDPDNPNVGGDEATNDELKKIEDEILKHARKYVDGFCMQYYSTYTDQGPLYKHMYKLSSGVVKKQIGNMIPKDDKSTHTTFGLLNRIIPDNGLEEWIKSAVVKAVEKKKINKTYGADYIKSLTRGMEHEKKNKYIIQLQQMYYAPKKRDDNTIIRTCEKLYEERQAVLENRLSQSISTLKQLYATHDGIISDLTNKIKSEFGECPDGDINDNKKLIDNNNTLMQNLEVIAESEINKHKEFIQSAMSELKFIYFNLMGNYEFIFQTRSIVLHLKSIRDTKVGKIKAPTKQELSDFINESIQSNTLESIKENL